MGEDSGTADVAVEQAEVIELIKLQFLKGFWTMYVTTNVNTSIFEAIQITSR